MTKCFPDLCKIQALEEAVVVEAAELNLFF
jgi:hypothetical protein